MEALKLFAIAMAVLGFCWMLYNMVIAVREEPRIAKIIANAMTSGMCTGISIVTLYFLYTIPK
jgi:hypothetical protein